MNVQQPLYMAKPDFLAWVEGREGRYELDDGRIIMMVGASWDHGLIVRNLLLSIHAQLDPQVWAVIAEFGVNTGPKSLRYPDIIVDRTNATGRDFTAVEPAFIAEVLSPTTESIDLGDKAAEYLKLPSLIAYLILAQDRCKAWLWVRNNNAFAAGPEVIAGADKIIHIAPLNLRLPLAALYIGVNIGN